MNNKLNALVERYSQCDGIKQRGIALKLKYIRELFSECSKSEELPLMAEIVDSFCEILESVGAPAPVDADEIPFVDDAFLFREEFPSDEDFFEVLRSYFSKKHAESTITDYINRIKTFRNKYALIYLKDIYGEDELSEGVEVSHIYVNIETILATFKPKTKTEMNIYSALRKLNEYKNHREL